MGVKGKQQHLKAVTVEQPLLVCIQLLVESELSDKIKVETETQVLEIQAAPAAVAVVQVEELVEHLLKIVLEVMVKCLEVVVPGVEGIMMQVVMVVQEILK